MYGYPRGKGEREGEIRSLVLTDTLLYIKYISNRIYCIPQRKIFNTL